MFPLLLKKTICSWAAAWTRASSSWDCALYKISPVLLCTTVQETSINLNHYSQGLIKMSKLRNMLTLTVFISGS